MGMQETIQLENYRLEPSEWAKVMYTYGLRKQMIRLIYPLAALGVGMVLMVPGQPVAILAGVLGFTALILLLRWNNIRQSLRNPMNRAVWSNRQVEFDASELRAALSDGTRSIIPIRNFVQFGEHAGYLFLYLSAIQYVPIPLTAFKTKSDEAALREILRQHNVPSDKTKRK